MIKKPNHRPIQIKIHHLSFKNSSGYEHPIIECPGDKAYHWPSFNKAIKNILLSRALWCIWHLRSIFVYLRHKRMLRHWTPVCKFARIIGGSLSRINISRLARVGTCNTVDSCSLLYTSLFTHAANSQSPCYCYHQHCNAQSYRRLAPPA